MTRKKNAIGRYTKRKITEKYHVVNNTVFKHVVKRNVKRSLALEELTELPSTSASNSDGNQSEEQAKVRLESIKTWEKHRLHQLRIHPDFYHDQKLEERFKVYIAKTNEAPEYICCCCHRKMYRQYVQYLPDKRTGLYEDCLKYLIASPDNKYWICKTCHRKLMKNQIPSQAAVNDLLLDEPPECMKNLNAVERALISKRLIFMKIMSSHVDKQKKMKGHVINVPAKLSPVCSILPRILDTNEMIHVEIKKQMHQKNHYIADNIATQKIFDSLLWLKKNNEHYSDVEINNQWTVEAGFEKIRNIQFQTEEYYRITDESPTVKFDWSMLVNYGEKSQLQNLRSEVEKNQYIPKYIKPDNNMLFRTFKYLVPKVKESLLELRILCTDIIEQNQFVYKERHIWDYLPVRDYIPIDNNTIEEFEYDESETVKTQANIELKKKCYILSIMKYLSTNMWHDIVSLMVLAKQYDVNVHVITGAGLDQIMVNERKGQYVSVAQIGEFVFLPLRKTKRYHNFPEIGVSDKTEKEFPFATCIQSEDLELGERSVIIAPSEDGDPKCLITETNYEAEAFPTYFPYGRGCYYSPGRPEEITLKDYFIRNLTHYSNTFSGDPDYIFTAQYTLETLQFFSDMQVAIKRVLGNYKGRRINAGLLKDPHLIKQMIDDNEALSFMKNVRGTPKFWMAAYYDAVSMLKQLDKPTWFLTLSAAEAHWPELLKILTKETGRIITDDDIYDMTWEEKCELLQSNSITVTRHFDHKFRALLNEVILNKEHNPCGVISEHFYRIEFQSRGSPHIHALLWDSSIDNSLSNTEDVISYIDQHQSCYLPTREEDESLHELVIARQKHSHNNKCLDSNGMCRYNFPFFPMKRTILVYHDKDHISSTSDNFDKLKINFVKAIKRDKLKCWTEFLGFLKLTYEEYESMLVDNTESEKLLLKRDLNAIWINYYNPTILRLWKSNMDFQFVANPYACIVYITSYMMKSEKTMSRMLKGMMHANRKEDTETKMKIAKRTYQVNREVSIQESGIRVLSIPLRGSSRNFVFVNSQIRIHRKGVVLDPQILKNMNDDDVEVFKSNIFDRYPMRPLEFESLTLSEFAADFDWHATRPVNGDIYQLMGKGNGYMKRRNIANIVRSFRSSIHQDTSKFIQSMLLLYVPWRDESVYDLPPDVLVDVYQKHEDIINKHQERFEKIPQDQLQKAMQVFEDYQMRSFQSDDKPDEYLNEDESDGENDMNHGIQTTEQQTKKKNKYRTTKKKPGFAFKPFIMTSEEYKRKYQKLTKKQQYLVDFCKKWCIDKMDSVKNKSPPPEPFFIFLHAPAGCGKSFCVSLILHDFFHILGKLPSVELRHLLALVTAYTGTAAFNVNGMTLHSALHLPIGSLINYRSLSRQKLQDLREYLSKVKLLIIDEISLVNPYMLRFISKRLQEIMGPYNNAPFGGINVILCGDIMQLSPVKALPVYTLIENDITGCNIDLWPLFCRHELTEVMRQSNNSLRDLLLRLRTGHHTVEDLEKLKSREISKLDQEDYPLQVLHVFATRAERDSHNKFVVKQLKQQGLQIFDLKAKYMEGNEGSLKYDNVKITESCPVFLTLNIDIPEGLVNGSLGYIRKLILDKEGEVETILIYFPDKCIGKSYRGKHQWNEHYGDCVPVTRHENFKQQHNNALSIIVNDMHFPIIPGWACTIHRVQGLTLDKIVVGMKGGLSQARKFQEGQAYVAFSRVRSLEDIYILNFNPDQIVANNCALDGISTMPEFSHDLHENLMCNMFDVSFLLLNIRGIQTNIEHLTHWLDARIGKYPTIMALTEARANHSFDFQGNERYNFYRSECVFDYREKTNIILAIRKTSDLSVENYPLNLEGFESDLGLWLVRKGDQGIFILIFYKSAYDNIETARNILKHILESNEELLSTYPMIVAGDFNIHNSKDSQNTMLLMLIEKDFEWLSTNATTEYGSCLDHIYTRNLRKQSEIDLKETYFSDHLGLFFSFEMV